MKKKNLSEERRQEKAWATYTGRLLWAMRCAGKTNQSELARAVGVRPQSIQYLCDPQAGARGSSHTPSLARELDVDAQWLATGTGEPHVPAAQAGLITSSATTSASEPMSAYGAASFAPAILWASQTVASSPDGELASVPSASGTVRMQARLEWSLGPFGAGIGGPYDEPDQEGAGHLGVDAILLKGNGLAPFAKDGQVLLLVNAPSDLQAEDVVLITLKTGGQMLRELMAVRHDSLMTLPVCGGQPQALDLQDVARLQLLVCVLPRRCVRGV